MCVYPSKGAEPELKLSSIPIRPIPLTSLVRLYDLEVDPTEQNDISNSNLEIVEFMLAQLVAFNQTQVPGMLISQQFQVHFYYGLVQTLFREKVNFLVFDLTWPYF